MWLWLFRVGCTAAWPCTLLFLWLTGRCTPAASIPEHPQPVPLGLLHCTATESDVCAILSLPAVPDTVEGDLDTLLEDLAAPMRGAEEGAPAPPVEPRRVGGPLLLRPRDALHLRIIVDHSCVEVYTGTGEVLSTRIYRGHAPDGGDAGIDFVAFGGEAVLERVTAWEMGSAWPEVTLETPKAGGVAVGGLGLAEAFGRPAGDGEDGLASPVVGSLAADRADALFDELLMGLPEMERQVASPMPIRAQ